MEDTLALRSRLDSWLARVAHPAPEPPAWPDPGPHPLLEEDLPAGDPREPDLDDRLALGLSVLAGDDPDELLELLDDARRLDPFPTRERLVPGFDLPPVE